MTEFHGSGKLVRGLAEEARDAMIRRSMAASRAPAGVVSRDAREPRAPEPRLVSAEAARDAMIRRGMR